MQALLQSNPLKLLSILLILCSCRVTIMCIEELTCLFLVWMVTSSAGSGRWQSQEKILSGLVAEAILLPWALEIYKDNRKWFGHTECRVLLHIIIPLLAFCFCPPFTILITIVVMVTTTIIPYHITPPPGSLLSSSTARQMF